MPDATIWYGLGGVIRVRIMPDYLVFDMDYNLPDQLVKRCNPGLLKGGEVCYESIIFHYFRAHWSNLGI